MFSLGSFSNHVFAARLRLGALCLSWVFVLCLVTRPVLGDVNLGESVWTEGAAQDVHDKLSGLAEKMKGSLGSIASQQTVLSAKKAFCQVLDVSFEALASAINILSERLSQLLQTAGLHVTLQKVNPEGVAFVCKWVLLALICYWLFSLAFHLVACTLRRALWLVKIGGALAVFGFILSDSSVGTETMAIRLATLVAVCVLLGIGTSGGGTAADKAAHMEQQVKILERRIREMEKWKNTKD